jgi:hypothetical protein
MVVNKRYTDPVVGLGIMDLNGAVEVVGWGAMV